MVKTTTMKNIIFLFLLILCSCQNSSKDIREAAQADSEAAVAYPSITEEIMVKLWEQCDFVDYIFYDYDFSLSQEEKAAIQTSINHITREVPVIDPACRSIGRIFYQIDGENVMEADIVVSEKCQYYVFYENGKKTYANKLSAAGIGFYQKIFQQFGQHKSNGG